MCVYFGFNIWHAAVAYFDGFTIEQFTKFMTWQKLLSYKIQKIIFDFCFDINTKWRVKPNNISFCISFVIAGIFVCWLILFLRMLVGRFELYGYIIFPYQVFGKAYSSNFPS